MNQTSQTKINKQPRSNGRPDQKPENSFEQLRSEVARGLRYCHTRINDNTSKTLEATAFLYSLIDILLEKEILAVEELDEHKKKRAQHLVDRFTESGLGLMYQDSDIDKYEFEQEAEVDCENSIPVCKAICCKLPFALSRQDVEEGLVKWEFEYPYIIAHGEDGYCVHLDRETYKCTIRDNRPLPCRGFDCRTSKRWPVWENYQEKQINVKFVDKINTESGKGRMLFDLAVNENNRNTDE